MPEHLIRLRGPWEVYFLANSPRPPTRLSLPVPVLPASEDSRLLLRHFGRPVQWNQDIPTVLRLDQVPGVVVVSLNGETVAEHPATESGPLEFPVARLLRPRNVLELTVAPGPDRTGERGLPWGSVSLIFGRDAVPTVDG